MYAILLENGRSEKGEINLLGTRIAILRRACGMSQTQLAKELGVSCSAVGMYEQERREPSLRMLVRMTEIFRVSMDFLVTGCPATPEEKLAMEALIQARADAAELKLEERRDRPLTRQELAELFAAMLLEP